MLLRRGKYFDNDVITLYYPDYAILYSAEGTERVKIFFINRLNYTGYMRLIWKIYF